MFAIWKHRDEAQKQEWLPRMAAGDAIGCFGLTDPDFGPNPAGMRTRARKDGSGKGMLLALHLGRLKDNGELRPEQVSVGKLNNVGEAIAIARECRTLLGAAGITLEYPMMRHANNLESVLTYEGTTEVHQLVVGQAVTGEAAFR